MDTLKQVRELKERIEITALAIQLRAKLKLYDKVILKGE